nr:PREDICTED: phosphatidylinositol N-acetylglucosaminyltransferase subunit H [Opisthocomus hoazin]
MSPESSEFDHFKALRCPPLCFPSRPAHLSPAEPQPLPHLGAPVTRHRPPAITPSSRLSEGLGSDPSAALGFPGPLKTPRTSSPSSVFAWLVLQNSMVLSAAIFVMLIGLIMYLHFTTFIEMSQVKDVVINEAIHMQKVIYYLCILLQDPRDPQGISEVVPLFQSSKPRLDCLIEVYRSCQEILDQRKTVPQ